MSIEECRDRVAGLCLGLPGAERSVNTGQHDAYTVGGKKFAYFLVDHHGDGRVAINCKVAPGFQASLIESDPERYFVPAYLGRRGWIAMELDTGDVDWDEVTWLIAGSYQLIAPRRLVALVDDSVAPGAAR